MVMADSRHWYYVRANFGFKNPQFLQCKEYFIKCSPHDFYLPTQEKLYCLTLLMIKRKIS